jgi:hypothetical protein
VSRINVAVGTASVEIRADDFTGPRGIYATPYRPQDLIHATVKALRAIDDNSANRLADEVARVLVPDAAP